MQWLYLLIAIVGEVVGTSTLKATEGFTRPLPSLIVIIVYAIAFYFLSLPLRTIPVGIAYALWGGIGIVLITFTGWIFYKQPLDLAAIIGIGCILLGVIVINLFSKTIPH